MSDTDYKLISVRMDTDTLGRLKNAVEALDQTTIGKVSMNTIVILAVKEWLDRFEADPKTGKK